MSLPYHPLYVQAYPQTSSQADVMPGGGVPSQTNEGPPSFYPSVLNPSQFQQQHQQQQPHIHQQQMQQMQQQQPHHLLHQTPHQNIQGQQPGQVASQTGLSALSLEVPSSESSVETHQYYQSMPMNAMPPTQTAYPLPGTISDRLQPLGLPRRPLVQKSQPTNQQQPQGYLPQLPPPVYPSHMQIPIEQISQPYQYASYPSVGYTPYINSNPSGYQYVQPFGVNQQFQRNFAKPTHLSENYIQSKRKMDKETTNTSASTSVSHFKPTKTKKNSKPRINKIQKAELASKKFDAKSSMASLEPIGEPSLDDLFEHFQLVLNIDIPPDSASGYYQLNLKNDLEHQLFDLFAHNLSNSIDIFLKHEVFKKVVPVLALHDETNMIMDSILCLSSLMLQRIRPDKIEPSIPIKYYHQCIKSIRYYLSIPGIENNEGIISRCLLSTILLCIYEMFFVAIDSTYVKGATSILLSIMSKHKQKNLLKESPFHEFCFLAVFVCDLILSLKFNSPSMYSIETFWRPLDNEYFQSFDNYFPQFTANNDGSKDGIYPPAGMILSKQQKVWWAYKTFLNLSSINDFNNEVQVITREDFEMNKPFQKWLELRTLIDEFELYLPIALKPIIYKPSGKDRVLPIIYFNDELTAIIGLNFKLLKLALYEALILKNNTEDAVVIQELQKYPANYCKKLCKDIIGIMKTYDGNTNVWANNIHTVRQVARYIADEPEVFEQFCALVDKIVAACHFKLQDNIV